MMSGFKGTPGPWSTRLEDSIYLIEAPDGDDSPWLVAEVMNNIGYEKDGAEDNAHLIAAAPELLEALIELKAAYSKPDEQLCCNGMDCGCRGSTTRQLAEHYADAAIAKALGEA